MVLDVFLSFDFFLYKHLFYTKGNDYLNERYSDIAIDGHDIEGDNYDEGDDDDYNKDYINPSAADVTFFQCTKKQKIMKIIYKPVMLVFIGKLSLSTFRWVPICHGFSHFSAFCHHFMLTKFATTSIRVNDEEEEEKEEVQYNNISVFDDDDVDEEEEEKMTINLIFCLQVQGC